jgi:hypothetical protein
MELNPLMSGSPEFAHQQIDKSPPSLFGQVSNCANTASNSVAHFEPPAIQNKRDPNLCEHPTQHALSKLMA